MTPRPKLLAPIALLACLLVAACSTTQPSTAPASAEPTEGAPAPGLILGCISIEAPECQFVSEHVVAALPAERGAPVAVEIYLYGCPNEGLCPRSLAVRGGKATVEFLEGEPIEMTLAGPPQNPRIGPAAGTWSGLVEAVSPRVGGFGPFPFDVGHCGISHVVDFDGSFWLPIGPVDGDASGFINGEAGRMVLLGPNLAQYQGDAGFVVHLARFPGPKHFWLCD